MIELGKKYQTRDGRAVRILATDMKSGDASIIGLVTMQNGSELVECWRGGGRSLELGVTESPSDLVPVPTKHEGWTYINPATKGMGTTLRATQEEAQAEIFCPNLVVVHATWED